jgi:plastocyanin
MKTAIAIVVLGILSPQASANNPTVKLGSLHGVVLFKGEAPVRKKLVRDGDPICATTERLNEDIVVTDGKLRDVVVSVMNPPAFDAATAAKQVVINQNQCMYEPRVVGILASQSLAVQNSDPTFHNVRATVGDASIWNSAHPKGAAAIVKDSVGKPGDVVELHCDVHGWMHAYAYVQASPFFAISGGDGTFDIAGLPPGKYQLQAIHPVLGKLNGVATIGKGKRAVAKVTFAFKAK